MWLTPLFGILSLAKIHVIGYNYDKIPGSRNARLCDGASEESFRCGDDHVIAVIRIWVTCNQQCCDDGAGCWKKSTIRQNDTNDSVSRPQLWRYIEQRCSYVQQCTIYKNEIQGLADVCGRGLLRLHYACVLPDEYGHDCRLDEFGKMFQGKISAPVEKGDDGEGCHLWSTLPDFELYQELIIDADIRSANNYCRTRRNTANNNTGDAQPVCAIYKDEKSGSSDYVVTFVECEVPVCYRDGGWSQWSASPVCDATCGTGTEWTVRLCDHPKPTYGGKSCKGPDKKDKSTCRRDPCPVHGAWGEWSLIGECSASCANTTGVKPYNRSCNNPVPAYGGNGCQGNAVRDEVCKLKTVCIGKGRATVSAAAVALPLVALFLLAVAFVCWYYRRRKQKSVNPHQEELMHLEKEHATLLGDLKTANEAGEDKGIKTALLKYSHFIGRNRHVIKPDRELLKQSKMILAHKRIIAMASGRVADELELVTDNLKEAVKNHYQSDIEEALIEYKFFFEDNSDKYEPDKELLEQAESLLKDADQLVSDTLRERLEAARVVLMSSIEACNPTEIKEALANYESIILAFQGKVVPDEHLIREAHAILNSKKLPYKLFKENELLKRELNKANTSNDVATIIEKLHAYEVFIREHDYHEAIKLDETITQESKKILAAKEVINDTIRNRNQQLQEGLEKACDSKNENEIQQALLDYENFAKEATVYTIVNHDLITRAIRIVTAHIEKRNLLTAVKSRDLGRIRLCSAIIEKCDMEEAFKQDISVAEAVGKALQHVEELRTNLINVRESAVDNLIGNENPSKTLQDIVRATLLILGSSEEELSNWDTCRRLLQPKWSDEYPGFLMRVGEFIVKYLHPEVAVRVLELLESYTDELAKAEGRSVFPLYAWSRAVAEQSLLDLETRPPAATGSRQVSLLQTMAAKIAEEKERTLAAVQAHQTRRRSSAAPRSSRRSTLVV